MQNILGLSSLAFQGDTLDRLSVRLRESRSATRKGIESALPVSIAGLAEHASLKHNAQALLDAIKEGNYPHVAATDLPKVVEDALATDRVVRSSSGFLKRIFGARARALIDTLATHTGLSRYAATTMLGLATPLVLDSVGKEARSKNLDAAGLARLLAEQRRQVSDHLPPTFSTSFGATNTNGATKMNGSARGLLAGPFVISDVSREALPLHRAHATPTPERVNVTSERPWVTQEPRRKTGLAWLLGGLAALGALALLALAVWRPSQPAPTVTLDEAGDIGARGVPAIATLGAPEVAPAETPGVSAPEVSAPETDSPEVSPPAVSSPQLDAPRAVAPKPSPQAPSVTGPDPEAARSTAAPAVATSPKPAPHDALTPEGESSGPPAYWILRDDALPLENYLESNDRVPQRFLLRGINFDTASSDVEKSPLLDEIASVLKSSGAKIRIDGHADDQGTAIDNQKLSLERAEAVKRYLVEQGVPPSQITTRGLSEYRPLAPNDSADHRAKNRRVELVVVER